MLDYFSSAALPPVNAASVDMSAGAEYIKQQAPDYSQIQKTFGGEKPLMTRGEFNRFRGAAPPGTRPPGLYGQTIEEEEEEEDPEWVEFDPKKAVGSFFGRSIKDESVLREKVQQEKERQIKAWNAGIRGPNVRNPSD